MGDREEMPMTAEINRRDFMGLSGAASIATVWALVSARGEAATFEVQHSPAEWLRRLGPARFRVLREEGTEPPFSSPLLKEHRKGIYACAGCALPLFSSAAKYDSGTGWPSFKKALAIAVAYERDRTFGMLRTKEHCRRCGGHLGHVFDDGPPPLGKRHCINGLSLAFKPS
jgi:peptide-methionine (R)-S-oxide reductase